MTTALVTSYTRIRVCPVWRKALMLRTWYDPAANLKVLLSNCRISPLGSDWIVFSVRVVQVVATPVPPLVPLALLSVSTATFRVRLSTSFLSLLMRIVLVWLS